MVVLVALLVTTSMASSILHRFTIIIPSQRSVSFDRNNKTELS